MQLLGRTAVQHLTTEMLNLDPNVKNISAHTRPSFGETIAAADSAWLYFSKRFPTDGRSTWTGAERRLRNVVGIGCVVVGRTALVHQLFSPLAVKIGNSGPLCLSLSDLDHSGLVHIDFSFVTFLLH